MSVSRRPTEGARPELNVTPLVDVVLVLLIVFMVVAPRLEHDVPVELPGVLNPDPLARATFEPIVVTIDAGGALHLAGRPGSPEEAVGALARLHAEAPGRELAIRADGATAYGRVRAVAAEARRLGFAGVTLLVGERHRDHPDGGES